MGFGPSPDSWRIRSTVATHFTGVLAQNAAEFETIGPLPTPQVVVTRVEVLSEQNLAWDVMFFRNNDSQPGDETTDAMIDWIEFLVADAVQIAGTGSFRYAVSGLSLRVLPDDGQLHIALINRSGTGKLAQGAGGDISIEVSGPVL